MPERKIVIISSTARDLPEHRKEVMDACLRQGMFPQMMEHLPASDADAIAVSLRLVDEADIYLGVFAYRYGYVPKSHDISITEMEYNRAVERGIPRLIFLMHEDHPVKASDVETGEGAQKLKAFKERLSVERVVSFFKSPADLRASVIQSLSSYRERAATAFHHISDIPRPPEIYVAHPYTLLQTRDLVGRQQELTSLTDWVAEPSSEVHEARILNIVAIGGMGKSALTWKWFNDIAPDKMKPMAGRMWWSFYESDATFENFIIRALAYVTGRERNDIEKNTRPVEREDMLLAILDHEPFLLVLDGLERILITYARMDANRLADDDLDHRTANFVANAPGPPEGTAQSSTGQHNLRKTADLRAGNFLRKLARVRASRILVSTRLYPADLQTGTGEAIPGSRAYFLRGLSDGDALNLWRAFKVSGSHNKLLQLFQSFDKHPLLIHALASKIANYRPAPGNYARWRKDNPEFNPFSLPIEQRKSHVLAFALHDLDASAKRALHTIAAFRMPATYDTLVAVLVGDDKVFPNENALDVALTELEDRGLLGWDKPGNRYDLHPIVRGVVWSLLERITINDIYGTLESYFNSRPLSLKKVESLSDLTVSIELYNALINLKRYGDAFVIFQDRLDHAMFYFLSANKERAELLRALFPEDAQGDEQSPNVTSDKTKAYVLNALAESYHHSYADKPNQASMMYRSAGLLYQKQNDSRNLNHNLCNLSGALRLSGKLRESEAAAKRALFNAVKDSDGHRKMLSLGYLGLALSVRGEIDDSNKALEQTLEMSRSQNSVLVEGTSNTGLSQRSIWIGEYERARSFADRAWQIAPAYRYERDFIRAARLQGQAAIALNDLQTSEERLCHALMRARTANFIAEEVQVLAALAELRRRQSDLQAAREFLDDVWEAAERGPYPLFHADALNVLAQIERDAGNHDKAVQAATEAYRKAWCDGPPFAYHWGLEAARKHLAELGAAEPTDLPPFDESKYEPMPDVEIDPPDLPVEPDSTDE